MGDRDGATAWYRSAVELLGAVIELRDHCHTWPPCAMDAANDESAKPAKAKRNKKSSRHTTLVNEAVRKWQLMLFEVQRLLEKIGSQPSRSFDGRVIRPGSGLLGVADDAFREVEQQLQDAQLDAAVGRFEVDGYDSQRYAWPVVAKVAADVQRWATEIAEHWLSNPPDRPRNIKSAFIGVPQEKWESADREESQLLTGCLELREAVDACPLSPELIAKLGARLDLEQAGLSRLAPAEGENKKCRKLSQKSGRPQGSKKNRDAQELYELKRFVELRREFETGSATGDSKYITTGARKGTYEAFFCWLQRSESVSEDLLDKWQDQGPRNVMKEAGRALPHLFADKPKARPQNSLYISGRKPSKKKSKISKR